VGAKHVDEHTITLDDSPVFYRSARPEGIPPVYVHGIPTSSDDWMGPLEHTGGIAPDLIGFGRSGKGGHLDYSPDGLAGFLGSLTHQIQLGAVQLVAHGWGVVAAIRFAAGNPERIRRLVLISPPAALPGFDWTWFQRAWRQPLLGELLMGSITRWVLAWGLRRASATPSAWPDGRVRAVWDQFDQGTQRAILRLHRSWNAEQAERLAADLATLPVPALILWGDRDPWCGRDLAEAYASRLPDSTLQPVPSAGHWPWLDAPEVVERISAWVTA
jgi:pimeloyl-ACP methyl ester carboxylesterase